VSKLKAVKLNRKKALHLPSPEGKDKQGNKWLPPETSINQQPTWERRRRRVSGFLLDLVASRILISGGTLYYWGAKQRQV
jgi:hypothetical protein